MIIFEDKHDPTINFLYTRACMFIFFIFSKKFFGFKWFLRLNSREISQIDSDILQFSLKLSHIYVTFELQDMETA